MCGWAALWTSVWGCIGNLGLLLPWRFQWSPCVCSCAGRGAPYSFARWLEPGHCMPVCHAHWKVVPMVEQWMPLHSHWWSGGRCLAGDRPTSYRSLSIRMRYFSLPRKLGWGSWLTCSNLAVCGSGWCLVFQWWPWLRPHLVHDRWRTSSSLTLRTLRGWYRFRESPDDVRV